MNAQLRTRVKNMTAEDLLADIERCQQAGSSDDELRELIEALMAERKVLADKAELFDYIARAHVSTKRVVFITEDTNCNLLSLEQVVRNTMRANPL